MMIFHERPRPAHTAGAPALPTMPNHAFTPRRRTVRAVVATLVATGALALTAPGAAPEPTDAPAPQAAPATRPTAEPPARDGHPDDSVGRPTPPFDARGGGRGAPGDGIERFREGRLRRGAPPSPDGPGNDDRGRGEPRPPFFQPLSEEEFADALEFMRQNMPAMYGLWEALPQPLRNRRVLPSRLHASFRILFEARESGDTELAELIERQLKLRDEFLADIVERRCRGEDRETIREALVEKTREIIQANLDQRELRLRAMERRMAEERERLEADRAAPDELLQSQMSALMDDSRRFIMALDRMKAARDAGDGGEPTTQPGRRGDGGRDRDGPPHERRPRD